MRLVIWGLIKVLFLVGFILVVSCTGKDAPPNLVPDQKSTAPNYWCTWYWQNYLIKQGEPVVAPDAQQIYSNQAAREELNEESILGENGMARVMLPKTRGEFYFLIDHGWQDKSIKENTFFTMIMDTLDFPSYSGLEPRDRIRKLNKEIIELGWRGLGLWVRGNISEEQARKFVEWSKYAGIEYWKIDGGDTRYYYTSRVKNEIYPDLMLEHVTGAGPLTPLWEQKGLNSYPSIYSPRIKDHPQNNRKNASVKILEILKNTDVVRTYDAAPLTVSTTTLQRIHDILSQTAGDPEYTAYLNIQDDPGIAAALGLLVAVKRHPLNGSRIYEGEDLHFQIRGRRRVGERLNEIDRMAVWQRIGAPMNAGYGTYAFSDIYLQDSIEYRPGDTWYRQSIGKMVHQGAPAILSRNIELPEVKSNGEFPYVMASKFQNGSIAIATEGRVKPGESWFQPLAEVVINIDDGLEPVGVFGYYKSLTLRLNRKLSAGERIWAQDLLDHKAEDISDFVIIKDKDLIIPGELITRIGTAKNDPGDISVPGIIIQILK